jgi:hypothetical protein
MKEGREREGIRAGALGINERRQGAFGQKAFFLLPIQNRGGVRGRAAAGQGKGAPAVPGHGGGREMA